jgi:hypothetical protein
MTPCPKPEPRPVKPRAWNSTLPASSRTGLPRVTHLRGRSSKRAAQERLYVTLRDAFMAEHPFCHHCGQASTELHHTAGRDAWRLTFVPWFLALCHDCHHKATIEPAWAQAVGLSRKRHDKPRGDAA